MSAPSAYFRGWIVEVSRGIAALDSPRSDKLFAVFRAYIDDSGSDGSSHSSVLAGYWASFVEWRRFERAWKAVLAKYGIEEFHAKHFFPRPGGKRIQEYKDWSDQAAESYLNELLGVIEKFEIYPFACGVVRSAWSEIPDIGRSALTGADKPSRQTPMLLSIRHIVTRTSSYCRGKQKMYYVYDRDESRPWLMPLLSRAFEDVRTSIKRAQAGIASGAQSIVPEDSRDSAPLQAADLLAFEARRWALKANGDRHHPMRQSYERAFSRALHPDDLWLFDAARFRNFAEFLQAWSV
ncbi:MAG: DUF3800 domain-containing protein [Patescibacteria group bacterium]|nr:DUF3800 domain-containing protein [Patescibacteria group bacterium]